MTKIEAGLLACAMALLVGMVVSTATMIAFPVIGFFIEVIFMVLIAAIVLVLIVPDIVKDIRNR